VPLRWYVISLLAPPLILLVALTVLYGLAPLRAPNQNWLLIFTSFLPALVIVVVLNNVAEEIGWTGFTFCPASRSSRSVSRGASDDGVLLAVGIIAVATRGRLGLKRSSQSSGDRLYE
jgi:hypothetical protein